MDVIEFLQTTDQRNLKNHINFLVKQKLRERNFELNERRRRLKGMLDAESLQYEMELSVLLKLQREEKEAQRLEWIGFMRTERERAEEELLEFKKKQLQLENAEEVRHIYSREMLLGSKEAQLYQIEEKKALREKQARTERYWLEVMRKHNRENEERDAVEQNLRKEIADVEQRKNLEQHAAMKAKARKEDKALREELNQDDIRARNIDKKYKKEEDFYEWRKKVYRRNVLERQMQEKAINAELQRQTERLDANTDSQQIQRAILNDLDQEGVRAVKNREQQKEYLKYTQNEKKLLLAHEKKLEDMFLGTGCVLEQTNKTPYGKNTR